MLGDIFVGVELDFGVLVKFRLVVCDVVLVDCGWSSVGCHGVESFGIFGVAAESADCSNHIVVEVADEVAFLVEYADYRVSILGIVCNQLLADVTNASKYACVRLWNKV